MTLFDRLPVCSIFLVALLSSSGCSRGVTPYNEGVKTYRRAAEMEVGSEQRQQLMEQSIAHFQRAIEVEPRFGEAHWNIALIRIEELDEPRAALEHLKRAKELFDAGHFLATEPAEQRRLDEKVRRTLALVKKTLGEPLSEEERRLLESQPPPGATSS